MDFMLTKVTFKPLKGRRYLVRKNGEVVMRGGKQLIVNEANIEATRCSLMNAGRKPPPPIPAFLRPRSLGRTTEGDYSTMWDNTFFSCPWCGDDNFRNGRTSGTTTCNYCNQPVTVTLSPNQPARRESLLNIGIDPDW
jgi:hypothetical protein